MRRASTGTQPFCRQDRAEEAEVRVDRPAQVGAEAVMLRGQPRFHAAIGVDGTIAAKP